MLVEIDVLMLPLEESAAPLAWALNTAAAAGPRLPPSWAGGGTDAAAQRDHSEFSGANEKVVVPAAADIERVSLVSASEPPASRACTERRTGAAQTTSVDTVYVYNGNVPKTRLPGTEMSGFPPPIAGPVDMKIRMESIQQEADHEREWQQARRQREAEQD